MRVLLLVMALCSYSLRAEVNLETHDFSFEYGLAYHSLTGKEEANDTEGRLTSDLNPYWLAGYSLRMSKSFAVKFFGGIHLVRFQEPAYGTLQHEDQVLNQFGIEFIKKSSPIFKWGFIVMQQDHPLYFSEGPAKFKVIKEKFVQSGLNFQLGQRRRIGLLWGLGLKGYTIFPTDGGEVATEAGVGGEGHVRLGWVGPLGTLYQIKGFYQATTAPNAAITFTHEVLGYCLLVSHSF